MSSIASGIFAAAGQQAAAGSEGQANLAAWQANQDLQNLGPAANMAAPINLQQYQQAGTINPQLAAAISAGPSAMSQVTTNGQGIAAQQQALQAMQQRAAGGMTAQDRAALAQAQLQAGQAAQSKQAQIMQQFQQMGQGGSGASLAAQLSAAQNGTNQLSQSANQIMGQSQQQALQAAAQAGGMGSQLESQQFGEAAQKAQAADQMQRFNIQNQLGVQQQNVGAQNQAQYANLANLQNVGNQNVSAANQAAYAQRAGEQQNFANSVGLAGAKAGASQQLGNFMNQQGQQQAQAMSNLGAGMGSSLGGIASLATGYNGGQVKSNSIGYNSGGEVYDYRNGGPVSGQAKVPGDSPVNDTVDAKLSPGEIVIPRSLAKSELGDKLLSLLNAHHEIKSHLDKAEKKSNKRPASQRNPMGTYDDGGSVDDSNSNSQDQSNWDKGAKSLSDAFKYTGGMIPGAKASGNGGTPFYTGGLANTGSDNITFDPNTPQDDMYMQNLLDQFYGRMSPQQKAVAPSMSADQMIGNKPLNPQSDASTSPQSYAQGGRVNYQGYADGGSVLDADGFPIGTPPGVKATSTPSEVIARASARANALPQYAAPQQAPVDPTLAQSATNFVQNMTKPQGMYDGGSVQPGYADGGDVDYDPDNHDDVFDQPSARDQAIGASLLPAGSTAQPSIADYDDRSMNAMDTDSSTGDQSGSDSSDTSSMKKLLAAFNTSQNKGSSNKQSTPSITVPQMPASNPQLQQALAGIAASKMAVPQGPQMGNPFQLPGMADGGKVPEKGTRQYLEYLMGQLKPPVKPPMKKMSKGGKVKGYADGTDEPISADDSSDDIDDQIRSAEDEQEPVDQSASAEPAPIPLKADLEEQALQDAKDTEAAQEAPLTKDELESAKEADAKKEVEGRDEDLQAGTDKDLQAEMDKSDTREPADDEFADADVKTQGLPEDVDTSASALRQAQKKRDFNEFMANQADAGALIAAGVAGHGATPASPAYFQGLHNAAGAPVRNYMEQVANQSEDPNSTMSQVVRDYMKSKGLQAPDNSSASDLFKVAPFLQKDQALQFQLKKTMFQQDQLNQRSQAARDAAMARQQSANAAKIEAARIAQENKKETSQQNAEVKAEADLNSTRGKQALMMAQRNLMSVKNAQKMLEEFPDTDKWTPGQVALFNSEIGKIATGGVPTEGQISELSNPTAASMMAKGSAFLKNVPVGADQSKFIALNKKYLDGLGDVSQKVIKDNIGNTIKSYQNKLSPDAYKNYVYRHSDMLGLFSPAQERGISNVMIKKGLSRQDAIQALVQQNLLKDVSY